MFLSRYVLNVSANIEENVKTIYGNADRLFGQRDAFEINAEIQNKASSMSRPRTNAAGPTTNGIITKVIYYTLFLFI